MAGICFCGECGQLIKGNAQSTRCSLCFHKECSGLTKAGFNEIVTLAKKKEIIIRPVIVGKKLKQCRQLPKSANR